MKRILGIREYQWYQSISSWSGNNSLLPLNMAEGLDLSCCSVEGDLKFDFLQCL
jgi:hypothetical protein